MRTHKKIWKIITKSIFIRFTLLLVITTFIISISLDWYVQKKLSAIIETAIKNESSTILQSLDWVIADLIDENLPQQIQRLLDNTASNRLIQSLTLYDLTGQAKVTSGEQKISHETVTKVLSSIKSSESLFETGRDSLTHELYYVVPVRGQSVAHETSKDWYGLLFLTVNHQYETYQLDTTLLVSRLNLLIIDSMILLLVAIMIFIYWIKPLNNLRQLSEAVANRDYSVQFITNDSIELGSLAKAFNYMIHEINHYLLELSEAKNVAEREAALKMQFFANMSHEIRTPLNLILGYLSLLEEESLPKEVTQKLSIVKNAGQQLLAIVNDILDVAKFDLDGVILENEPISIPEILIDLFAVFQPQSEEKNVRLRMVLDQNCPHYFYGDSYRIQQILNNLIANAIKFTSAGQVLLTASYEAPYLALSVKDSGIGIAEDKQKLIFEAFKQTDMSTTRQYGGTGLGLAIVKRLCETMEGKIVLESALGSGSTFTAYLQLIPVPLTDDLITENKVVEWQLKDLEISDLIDMVVKSLPERVSNFEKSIALKDFEALEEYVHALKGVAGNFKMTELYEPLVAMDNDLKDGFNPTKAFYEAFDTFMKAYNNIPSRYFSTTAKGSPSETNDLESSTFRILLAEDVQENRMLIRHMLAKLPCTLDEAEDGQVALDKIEAHSYDILLLDMHMPNVDGMTVLKTLRANSLYDSLIIVAMTASIQQHEVNAYYQSGINHILPKPVDKVLLRQFVLEAAKKQNKI